MTYEEIEKLFHDGTMAVKFNDRIGFATGLERRWPSGYREKDGVTELTVLFPADPSGDRFEKTFNAKTIFMREGLPTVIDIAS